MGMRSHDFLNVMFDTLPLNLSLELLKQKSKPYVRPACLNLSLLVSARYGR